jgi:hypothetical protein
MKLNSRSQQPLPRRKLVSGVFSVAALFLATGTAHTHDPTDNRDADWIFKCPVSGDVYIYEHPRFGFTVRGLEPPFQLAWAEDREPVLTVENKKCELIYPVEQG